MLFALFLKYSYFRYFLGCNHIIVFSKLFLSLSLPWPAERLYLLFPALLRGSKRTLKLFYCFFRLRFRLCLKSYILALSIDPYLAKIKSRFSLSVSILAIIHRYHKDYFILVINLIEKSVASYSIAPGIRLMV